MILYLNDYQVCSSNATYGGDGATTTTGSNGEKWETINEMTGCNEPIKVKKGDYSRIESQYDLEQHPV